MAQDKLCEETFRKNKLFIATPMFGGLCHGMYTKSMTALSSLCSSQGIHLNFFAMANESLIQRARNKCAAAFLDSDCTHLMFIDADIGFNPKDVLGMLAISTMDKEEKYSVLAASYPTKKIAWDKIKLAVEKGFASENPENLERFTGGYFAFDGFPGHPLVANAPVKVFHAGTGFMLIPRKTLENFIKVYPEHFYLEFQNPDDDPSKAKKIHAFFDCEIDAETKKYISEDYLFCARVRKMDGEIWLLPWITLIHAGCYHFQGTLAHTVLLNQNAAATNPCQQ